MELLGWTVDDLMQRDSQEITVKMIEAADKVTCHKELFIFQPCIDGYSITEVPGVLIKEGKFPRDVSLMCGTVSGDSWMFSRKVRKELTGDAEAQRAFSYSPQIAWGRTQIANGLRPLYSYYFEHIRPGEKPKLTPDGLSQLLAHHGAEIAYVFGNLDALADRFNWQEYDYKLSLAMLTYWVNYAKTGNPNGEGLPQWPPFTKDAPLTMNFRDDGFDMRDLVDNERAEQVIRFTIDNPGMLETLENFKKA
jgi:carboxylesterase type B